MPNFYPYNDAEVLIVTIVNERSPALDQPIKLVFFDVDGTLLDQDGQFSSRLQRCLQGLKHAGVKLAIASGRPPFACEFLFDGLGINDAGLFFTGGLIYQPREKKIVMQQTLSQAQALAVLQQAKSCGLHRELYDDSNWYIEAETPISQEHARQLRCSPKLGPLEQRLEGSAGPWFKLLLGEDGRRSQQLPQLEAQFPHLHFAYAKLPAYPHWQFASVIPAAADKRLAFQQLLEIHRCEAREVMAFGDAGSDKVFLESAGVGVAMANAAQDVQSVANFVCPRAQEDGVAIALERLLAHQLPFASTDRL